MPDPQATELEFKDAQACYKAATHEAREQRRETFRRAHKTLSVRQIAKVAGLSPTRVQQILDGD